MSPGTISSFRTLADLLPEPVLLVSGQGILLAANRCLARILGMPAPELEQKPLSRFIVAPDEEALEQYLLSCSRTREIVLGTLMLLDRSGEEQAYRAEGAVAEPRTNTAPAVILLRLLPRTDALDRFTLLNQRIDALTQEIAARKRTELQLQEQREWLQTTLASIGDAVIATDAEGRVLFMNAPAQELTGWSQEEARGQAMEDVFPIVNETTGKPVDAPVRIVLREGRVVGLANHTILLSREGTRWPIDDSAAPIRDGSGSILGVVMTFREISERRRAEEALRASAAAIREAAQQQRRFLREMLFSMTEGGLRLCDSRDDLPAPLEPISEPVPLSTATLRRLRQKIMNASRSIAFSPEREYDLITGAHEAAMNAVIHGGGGTGRVHADANRGTVQVWVEDNGNGIREDAIHRATLERGWTTAGTLGHGFWLLLKSCDRVYLLTGPEGTSVVLEKDKRDILPEWAQRPDEQGQSAGQAQAENQTGDGDNS